MACLIGCDLGTTSTKTGLFDEHGTLLASSVQEAPLIYGKDGSVIQDPYQMLDSVLKGIRDVLEQSQVPASEVLAVALDGQMAGIMGVSRDGEPATPYDSWLDIRSAPYADLMKQHDEELIIRRSGMAPSINFGPKILWWKQERPDVYKTIDRFTVPADWVAQKLAGLSGEETFIDPTYIHFSCFADLARNQWDEELIRMFSLEKEKFPRIVDPWTVVGRLGKEWAEKTGLLSGTPLAAGCGDQAANVLGAGVVEEGVAFDIAGTASCFCLNVKEYAPDVQHRTLLFPRSVLPDYFYPMAYINGGGMDLEWAKNQLFQELAHHPDAFTRITRLLEKNAPDPSKIVFIPHLRGRNCPTQPAMRGVFAGFSWDHTREHLFRAILEGIAYEYAFYLKIIKELIPAVTFQEVRVIGGGSKSAFWNQMKSSILGIPYAVLNRQECAIWGAALVAGYAVGAFPDLAAQSAGSVSMVERFMPDEELNQTYAPFLSFYLDTMEGMGNVLTRHQHLL